MLAAAFVGWGIIDFIILLIILAAVVAVAVVVIRYGFGINIPPWVVKVFWIVVAAVVAIVAIRVLVALW